MVVQKTLFVPCIVVKPEVGVALAISGFIHLVCYATDTHDKRQYRGFSQGVTPSYMMGEDEKRPRDA